MLNARYRTCDKCWFSLERRHDRLKKPSCPRNWSPNSLKSVGNRAFRLKSGSSILSYTRHTPAYSASCSYWLFVASSFHALDCSYTVCQGIHQTSTQLISIRLFLNKFREIMMKNGSCGESFRRPWEEWSWVCLVCSSNVQHPVLVDGGFGRYHCACQRPRRQELTTCMGS